MRKPTFELSPVSLRSARINVLIIVNVEPELAIQGTKTEREERRDTHRQHSYYEECVCERVESSVRAEKT